MHGPRIYKIAPYGSEGRPNFFYSFPATHGSGVGFVNMAAMVTKLELITGEGKILTLSTQNNRDIFNAAQVC